MVTGGITVAADGIVVTGGMSINSGGLTVRTVLYVTYTFMLM